jgi:predicted phage tail protein
MQHPISNVYGGSGSTSITVTPNLEITYPAAGTTWPTISPGQPVTAVERTSAELNLSASTARQVDELRIVFNYPQGLIVTSALGGKHHGLAAYLIELAFDYGSGFGSYDNYKTDDEFFYHVHEKQTSFYIQEVLDLEPFQPFNDFKLRITRATRDDENPKGSFGYDRDNTISLGSTLASVTSIIKERFTYPWTAYANVVVDAKAFNNIPKRSYHCKGRLVRVPSNYVTRDEAIDGKASYKRNVSNGAVESTVQDWDGNFRGALVYTNNPAWVFYDIISNSRYGLGQWLKASDVDKYALYRIARYCDELVPDGKGGEEPRFVSNVYLSKAIDTYKVLKDMATTFRAILYWSEGNIFAVTDSYKEPVYNFTKGNVIEGIFKYESSASKLRSNQVAVTWNNPDNDYVPEVLLVEDKENIAKTGKIMTEEVVAFGCTSIGQATRYGRWKLWTAINQKEVVSFSTAINAAFLAPGDIVNIQDADKYDISYSGRVSNTAGTDTDTVKLDRNVTLNDGSSYKLSVLIEESAAYLQQDSATIGIGAGSFIIGKSYTILTVGNTNFTSVGATNNNVGTTFTATGAGTGTGIATHGFVRGDRIAGTYTEATAVNITDSVGNEVAVEWAPYTHVEEQIVSTGASTTNSLDVSTAFSAAPNAETIWVLRETINNIDVDSSKKMYKILGITEEGKNAYGINAVEHFNEKFEAVDIDFDHPYVDTLIAPSINVPSPRNLTVSIS